MCGDDCLSTTMCDQLHVVLTTVADTGVSFHFCLPTVSSDTSPPLGSTQSPPLASARATPAPTPRAAPAKSSFFRGNPIGHSICHIIRGSIPQYLCIFEMKFQKRVGINTSPSSGYIGRFAIVCRSVRTSNCKIMDYFQYKIIYHGQFDSTYHSAFSMEKEGIYVVNGTFAEVAPGQSVLRLTSNCTIFGHCSLANRHLSREIPHYPCIFNSKVHKRVTVGIYVLQFVPGTNRRTSPAERAGS